MTRYVHPRVLPIHSDLIATTSNCPPPSSFFASFIQLNRPLTPTQVFEDISAEHAYKTVTIEPFPHSAKLTLASVHPCKHASVMKKVIERMNAGVTAEQRRALASNSSNTGNGANGGSKDKDKDGKKRWLGGTVGGMVRKVTGGTPGTASPAAVPGSAAASSSQQSFADQQTSAAPADEGDPMRVDFYLVVFLKFIASIVPTIEVDSTTPF